MKSNLFFHCLSYQIGTQHLVKLRQKLFSQTFENILPVLHPGFYINIIGSKSEGLDFEGSDTDQLFFIQFAYETESIYDKCKSSPLTYCSLEDSVYPGYVILRNRGKEIDSCAYLNFVQENIKRERGILLFSKHGPAMAQSVHGKDTDFVFAMASLNWPKIADGWKRQRNFGWPSEEMTTNITKKGCHLVPVGSKRNHDIDTEWRLSFCVAERELVWTFNQTQILIYGLLKLVLKEIINPICIEKDLICSYFLKTVMFWVIEETNPSIWFPNNMMFLFHLTFNRLVQCVTENKCPNYFIPSNNMLKDRINDADREQLLRLLLDIEDSGMAWMYRSKSLSPFADLFGINLPCNKYDIHSIRLKSIKKGVICSYLLIQELVFHYRIRISLMHNTNKKIIKNIFKSIKSLTIKRNVLPLLVHFIKTNEHSTENKTSASLHKFCMDLHIKDAFGSMPSGRNTLLSHFYCEGRFNDCLHILNSMVGDMDLCATYNTIKTSRYDYLFRVCIHCASTLTHLKYFFVRDIHIPFTSHLLSNELTILRPMEQSSKFHLKQLGVSHVDVDHSTFIHFVRCLCFIKLGLYSDFDEECELLFKEKSNIVNMFLLIELKALKKEIIPDIPNEANFMRDNEFEILIKSLSLFNDGDCIPEHINPGCFEQMSEAQLGFLKSIRECIYKPCDQQAVINSIKKNLSEMPPGYYHIFKKA